MISFLLLALTSISNSQATFELPLNFTGNLIANGARAKVVEVKEFKEGDKTYYAVAVIPQKGPFAGERRWVTYDANDPHLKLFGRMATDPESRKALVKATSDENALPADQINKAGWVVLTQSLPSKDDPKFQGRLAEMVGMLPSMGTRVSTPRELDPYADDTRTCAEIEKDQADAEVERIIASAQQVMGNFVHTKNQDLAQECRSALPTERTTTVTKFQMSGCSPTGKKMIHTDYTVSSEGGKISVIPNVELRMFSTGGPTIDEADAQNYISKLRAKCEPMLQELFKRYNIDLKIKYAWNTSSSGEGYWINTSSPGFASRRHFARDTGATLWDCVRDCYRDSEALVTGCKTSCGRERSDRDYCGKFIQYVGTKMGLSYQYVDETLPQGCSKDQVAVASYPVSMMLDTGGPIEKQDIFPQDLVKILTPLCKATENDAI